MIIHKPTFMAALSQNRVASHLILAMCAMSAPFSQSPQVKSQPPRLAGIKFYEDALNILFDSSGRLICDASLQTVQALCLLEMHDVVAQYSWTKCYRYLGRQFPHQPLWPTDDNPRNQDIASKILFETLDIASPESPPLSPKPTIEEMNRMTDRECARRCYWIIYFLHVLSTACTRNVRRFSAEGMLMRLPVDETSFELGIQSQSPGKHPRLIENLDLMCLLFSTQNTWMKWHQRLITYQNSATLPGSRHCFRRWRTPSVSNSPLASVLSDQVLTDLDLSG